MKLMNGELECEYRCYELFEGKNKDFKTKRKEMGRRDEWNPERARKTFIHDSRKFEKGGKPYKRNEKPADKKDYSPYNRNRKTIKKY